MNDDVLTLASEDNGREPKFQLQATQNSEMMKEEEEGLETEPGPENNATMSMTPASTGTTERSSEEPTSTGRMLQVWE